MKTGNSGSRQEEANRSRGGEKVLFYLFIFLLCHRVFAVPWLKKEMIRATPSTRAGETNLKSVLETKARFELTTAGAAFLSVEPERTANWARAV